jgi:aspartate kinase
VLTLRLPTQVIRKKIPIRIKNVENPSGGGTVIHPDPDIDAAQGDPITPTHSRSPSRSNSLHSFSPSPLSSFDDHERARRKRLPTAVTIKDKIVVLNINSNRKTISHGFLAKIFSNLDRFGVVVDLISTSEVHVSMAIEDSLGKKVLDRLVSELRKSGTVWFPLLALSRIIYLL